MAKIVRRTADQAAKQAYVDQDLLSATTDLDIERQMAEDGEDPNADYNDWHPSAAQVRRQLGLTQLEIARLLGMPLGTWRNWEQGRTVIEAPGRALLFLLQKEPKAVLRAMKKRHAA